MKMFFGFCLFLIGWHSQAQDTTLFNYRYVMNYRVALFTGLEVTDSCIYTTGVMYDTSFVDPNYLLAGSFIAKFDTFGNLLWTKDLMDTGQTYDIWNPTLYTTPDGNLITCGYSYINPDIMCARLFKFSTNGDTLWTKKYSLDTADIFLRPDDMVLTNKGSFILCAKHRVGGAANGGISLWGVDSLGNLEWTRSFYDPNFYNQLPKLERNYDDKFLLSYVGQRPKYLLIDSVGNYSWNYSPPLNSGIGAANDILVTRDSAWVFGTVNVSC
jgi:hypothetical protein